LSQKDYPHDIFATFIAWFHTATYREERRFLEAHPELLDPRVDTLLDQDITVREHSVIGTQQSPVDPPEEVKNSPQAMRDALELLRELRQLRATGMTIREVYVEMYGGLTLDLPPWLEEVEDQLELFRELEPSEQTDVTLVELLFDAIGYARGNHTIAPEILAELQRKLGNALEESLSVDRASACEIAVAAYKAALQVYTQARYPRQYARTQHYLGLSYGRRLLGGRKSNLERALTCHQAALQIFTSQAFPQEWAATQNNLGSVYRERISGKRSANLEQAITCYEAALRVYTLADAPEQWAMVQNSLGNTYSERIEGERGTNQERAIACCEAALQVYTPAAFPQEWAMVQCNLGHSYSERITGERRTNLERAIAYYETALQVYTPSTYLREWAHVQSSLGNAYQARIEGERRANLERAIAYYETALQVYTRETSPVEWARVQNNLGHAYQERIEGEHRANVEQAITHYTSALSVRTPEIFPSQWATTQLNLGVAYQERVEGERRANIEQAIACYEAALSVHTRRAFPTEWAVLQNNLGNAYQERILGERRTNLEHAIAYYKAALRISTYEALPVEWAKLHNNLGNAYRERIEGEQRGNLERAIAHHKTALRVFTYEAFPTEWARTLHQLGNAYHERVKGQRRANIEQAISCHESALRVYTKEAFPAEWASVQNSLGIAYRERIEGKKRANLEQAIACYEGALQVYTSEYFPLQWAATQHNLGAAHQERIEGEQRANLEQALLCYEAALQVYTEEAFPTDWAMTQHNLGVVYQERIEGDQQINIEQAIDCYKAALQVYTPHGFPSEYTSVLQNLGNAYCQRIAGSQRTNREQAIACYEAALEVRTRSAFPIDWAKTHSNLGIAYYSRIEGERRSNLEQAIACYEAALQIYTRQDFPMDWARVQHNLGNAYYRRIEGERQNNLEQAIACHEAALQVYTLDAFPANHRFVQMDRALVEGERQRWGDAHTAYASAHAVEDILVRLGAGVVGHDAVLKEDHDAAAGDSFALIRLGQIESAALALERGRAKGLAEALALDAADPQHISDRNRRKRYEDARQAFIAAQVSLNDLFSHDLSESKHRRTMLERADSYHKARAAFDEVVAEIRAARDPADFLNAPLDATTILRAAACGGPGHALVYLTPTQWGGIALAAVSADQSGGRPAHFVALDLPALTYAFVDDLIQTILEKEGTEWVIGGYGHAQEGNGFKLLREQWEDDTFRTVAGALHKICTATDTESTLDSAVQQVINVPQLAHLVDQPFDQLSKAETTRLANTLEHHFLQKELQRCLEKLAEVVMRPLIAWIAEQDIASLTLIPCETLAVFPLTAILLAEGSRRVPTSIALSARSLLREEDGVRVRAGVYALGDPRPTHQTLPWSEAEAHTLVKLARTLGLEGNARVHERAGRSWFIQALQTGQVVAASCHGKLDANDFRWSSLRLAKGERLTLAEALNRKVDLQGVRLLILSACQTATLAIRGARNEVRSLAAGMIQAGARAVLAVLWSVDDQATYLLVVRFAQEWFPKMGHEAPAAALIRAQHWLRTVTNRELQHWRATSLPGITVEERQQAGSMTPLHDPWKEEQGALAGMAKGVAVRGRGDRYELSEAETLINTTAAKQDVQDACPYVNPIYWAGFQVVGW
jgi:tetratricopeptide (TPR) repeat protein